MDIAMENKARDFNVSTALHGLLSSDSAVAEAAWQWCEERRDDPLEWLKELLTYLSINRDLKSKIEHEGLGFGEE
ncbi:unnamed protein product [Vitrella brassicaformis CCMP3155]|uniref:Uncharacterized protein n=1 Tax=Vitrella brassicaformis (strain CCMP3155) TaxID=1169540 RepID=A0A0G4G519_VITBC|nr:unnamed protein product [Vitrella brassicaformis CCMP3155]|eukprot:CEM23416.1 unnamed protein product [Vitrella brassicaformis CCMP3155]